MTDGKDAHPKRRIPCRHPETQEGSHAVKTGADEVNAVPDMMAEGMERNCMEAGKTLAELFRAMRDAASTLPHLHLRTEMMSVSNSKNGLTVTFHRYKDGNPEHMNCRIRHDYGDEEDFRKFDEEEHLREY